MGIICIDERVWNSFMGKLATLSALARQVDRMYNPAKKEYWMESADVCRALDISKRTLQSYRERGNIPFSNVGGKYFYKESDIAAYLELKTKPKKA